MSLTIDGGSPALTGTVSAVIIVSVDDMTVSYRSQFYTYLTQDASHKSHADYITAPRRKEQYLLNLRNIIFVLIPKIHTVYENGAPHEISTS